MKWVCGKPSDPAYPEELKTVGDHLRKKRLDLKMTQKELASRLGVTANTLVNWELGVNVPYVSCFPAILIFLGYDPLYEDDGSLKEVVKHYRRRKGLRLVELAKQIGIDPGTLSRVEEGRKVMHKTAKLIGRYCLTQREELRNTKARQF